MARRRPAEPSGRLPGALNGAGTPPTFGIPATLMLAAPAVPQGAPSTVSSVAPWPSMPRDPVPVRVRPGVGRSACPDAGIRNPLGPMARPAVHTSLPGCPHVVGHLAVDAILRNRSWLPWSRLRQSLYRSSLQNPRLPGSPARRAPPDRRTRQTASGFSCPWGCIHLPVRLASARRRTQPPSPSCPLGRWTDRSGHGRRRERPARPEPVA